MNNKRGLSDIVATLIIILLVIVAAGIIWVVVRNVVQSGADQIELGQKCIAVNIEYVSVIETTSGTYNVTLTRRAGGEEIAGVKIALFNDAGVTSGVMNFISIGVLETKPQTFVTGTTDNSTVVLNATKIQWTPYFLDSAGREMACQNTRDRIF